MPGRVLLEKFLDRMTAYTVYHFLNAHGMPVSIADRPLQGALGEIPFVEIPTELYLDDPERLEEARALIERYRRAPQGVRGATWQCPVCEEVHEPEFGACWNCGTTRP